MVGVSPDLRGGDGVKDPVTIASKARGVVEPSLGRRAFGLPPLPIDIPGIIFLERWSEVVGEDDVL